MVTTHTFAHGDFASRVRDYSAGFRFKVGENLGTIEGRNVTVALMIAKWMDSPQHRRNLMEPRFRHVGVGVVARSIIGRAGATYTADFGWRQGQRR